MIRYIGSKRAVVPLLEGLARRLPIASVCDMFAGTARVGEAFRRAGCRVVSNDLASYSKALGHAYIAAGDRRGRCRSRAARLPADQPDRGSRPRRLDLRPADGLSQAARTPQLRPLELREPAPVEGPAGTVTRETADDLARAREGVDCAYLDPPYNQHSYFSNYHAWETIVRGDRPEAFGVARKRIDCRTTRSPFNSARDAWAALTDLVEALRTPWVILSINDEGFHEPAAVAGLLGGRGHVAALAMDVPRYVGARIGIHNPSGQRVGAVSHVRATEWLIVCGPDRAAVESAFDDTAAVAEVTPAGV